VHVDRHPAHAFTAPPRAEVAGFTVIVQLTMSRAILRCQAASRPMPTAGPLGAGWSSGNACVGGEQRLEGRLDAAGDHEHGTGRFADEAPGDAAEQHRASGAIATRSDDE
jgi:hypothetical protein